MTLRLRDLAGEVVELRFAPRVPVTVGVQPDGDRATVVRRLLRADLIRRVALRDRAVAAIAPVAAHGDELSGWAADVGCPPLLLPADADRCSVVVGRSAYDGAVVVSPPADGQPLPPASGLQLRHALLAALDVPSDEVDRWQRAVADWAELPSKPMCAEYLQRANDCVDDELDTPAMLGVLRELEADDTLPPGSKFETFVHLDAILGLDLASRVGQQR